MTRARWILVIGWAVVIFYGFPGIMTWDSFDQLREARAGIYTDAHPPAMAVIWRYLDMLVPGPFCWFVLQTAGFLLGLALILRRTFAPARAAWITVALFLFPPVLAPMAVVWKDAPMAACLILGAALLLDERRGARLAGLAALGLATALRYNAPAATLPLIVLLFQWSPAHRAVKRYAISLAAWVVVTAAALGIGGALTDKPMHFWHSSLAVYDIAGTLAYVDHDIPDDELRPWMAPTLPLIDHDYHRAIRARYSTFDFAPLIRGEGHIWELPIWGDVPAPEAQRDAIAALWKHVVFGYPLAYARYRLDITAEILGLPRTPHTLMVMVSRGQLKELSVYFGLSVRPASLQNRVQRGVELIATATPLFRPIVYFAIALVLLVVSILRRRDRDVLALVLSGLFYEGSLFLLAASGDYRYSQWMVVCTCLGGVMLLGRRRRAQPPP